MSEEINDIIEYFKNDNWYVIFNAEECNEEPYKLLSPIEVYQIIGYISLLQSQREFSDKRNSNQRIANNDLVNEVERLKTRVKTIKRQRKKETHKKNIYKSRLDKATKFLEEHSNNGAEYLSTFEVKKLLETLKGEDTNEL